MKKIKLITLTVLTLSISSMSNAQDVLSLENAIVLALEKNFDIKLADNSLLQSENNATIQNSGYLPTVSASANAKYARNNAFVITQDGVENSIKGIETVTYGASLALSYTLFNGGSRKNQYEKLKTIYELSNVQKRMQIDNTIVEVYTTYYNIARQTLSKQILEAAFEISKQRLIRVQYQFDFGQKTSLDILNAKVDANNDSLNILNADIQLLNFKRRINFLLGQNIETEFDVEETVEVNNVLDYNLIHEGMLSNNYQNKQVDLNKTISEYDLKINQSGWVPNVSTNVSYGLNNGQYGPTALFATQNSYGLNAGLNLNWNVFDGGGTNVKVQNAKINLQNQEIYKQQLLLNLETELANTWSNYLNQLTIINAENLNLKVSEQNFEKTEERFNLGQISSIDFRQAQLNLVNSKVNLLNAQFDAKIAEVQLKKLEGNLVSVKVN